MGSSMTEAITAPTTARARLVWLTSQSSLSLQP
jgi:hypothetical protein